MSDSVLVATHLLMCVFCARQQGGSVQVAACRQGCVCSCSLRLCEQQTVLPAHSVWWGQPTLLGGYPGCAKLCYRVASVNCTRMGSRVVSKCQLGSPLNRLGASAWLQPQPGFSLSLAPSWRRCCRGGATAVTPGASYSLCETFQTMQWRSVECHLANRQQWLLC